MTNTLSYFALSHQIQITNLSHLNNLRLRKYKLKLNRHDKHSYLALLLLHRVADLVLHLPALLRGGGLAPLLELCVALLLLDWGALDLLHVIADLLILGGAHILVYRGALLLLHSPALILLDSLLGATNKFSFESIE